MNDIYVHSFVYTHVLEMGDRDVKEKIWKSAWMDDLDLDIILLPTGEGIQ